MRRVRARSRAVHQHSLAIVSIGAATKALARLESGEATLVKTMRNGRPTLTIRSEVEGSAWEARIAPDLHFFFREFFQRYGHHDGLFEDTPQTASIMEISK
jgi:hypothetical protein